MNLKKSTLKVAGVVSLAALIVTLAAPRAVHALAATLVQVTNTSTNPVVNQDSDNKDRNPYYETVSCYSASTNQCEAQFPVVPAGKRLVVEYISSSIDTPTPLISGEFFQSGPVFLSILFTLQGPDPAGNKVYVASQPMLYYFEAGQAPYFAMNAGAGNFEFMSGSITLTGHYVTL